MENNSKVNCAEDKNAGELVCLSLWEQEKMDELLKGITLAANSSKLPSDPEVEAVALDNLDFDHLSISEKMNCLTCDVTFNDRSQQVSHYRSDWHRFNIKQKLRGIKSVSEDVFEEMTGDISSISGSDWDSEEDTSAREAVNTIARGFIKDEDEDSFHVEGVGRRHPRVFLRNHDGQLISILRAVLYSKISHPETSEELLSIASTVHRQLKWVILMVAGGHFAGAVYDCDKVVDHKTFHRYVVRAKRGTVQSSHDSQGGHAKSAGASMRRHHEAALFTDINKLLEDWAGHMKSCDRIFLRAAGAHKNTLFNGKTPALHKKDGRIRLIPFPTRRPTFNEIKRVHTRLMTVHCHGTESDFLDEISPKKIKAKFEKKAGQDKIVTETSKSVHISVPDEASSSSGGDIDLVSESMDLATNELQQFECTKKPRRRKKKKAKERESAVSGLLELSKSREPNTDLSESSNQLEGDTTSSTPTKDVFCGLRNELYSAAKTGGSENLGDLLQRLQSLCDPGVSVQEVVNEPIDREGSTLLHVSSAAGQSAVISLLLSAGADPTVRNNQGQFPYVVSADKETRNEYRRFMAQYPDKYLYSVAQIPAPLTQEMEEVKRAKEAEKKKALKKIRKEKQKAQKEISKKENAEREEKERFLALSDREKRALAAEKRLAAQQTQRVASTIARCFECGEDMTGKVPFEYNDNKFCTTKCLQQHRKSALQR